MLTFLEPKSQSRVSLSPRFRRKLLNRFSVLRAFEVFEENDLK